MNERLILRRLIALYESRLLDDDDDGRAAGADVLWVVKYSDKSAVSEPSMTWCLNNVEREDTWSELIGL